MSFEEFKKLLENPPKPLIEIMDISVEERERIIQEAIEWYEEFRGSEQESRDENKRRTR